MLARNTKDTLTLSFAVTISIIASLFLYSVILPNYSFGRACSLFDGVALPDRSGYILYHSGLLLYSITLLGLFFVIFPHRVDRGSLLRLILSALLIYPPWWILIDSPLILSFMTALLLSPPTLIEFSAIAIGLSLLVIVLLTLLFLLTAILLRFMLNLHTTRIRLFLYHATAVATGIVFGYFALAEFLKPFFPPLYE